MPKYVIWITNGKNVRFLRRISRVGRQVVGTKHPGLALQMSHQTAWAIATEAVWAINGRALLVVARA